MAEDKTQELVERLEFASGGIRRALKESGARPDGLGLVLGAMAETIAIQNTALIALLAALTSKTGE